ncbi:ATP-binding protein [Pontibacter toksunensis]|uniref:histidine kinase n=1 Tax=Pontibacter toksunensis TaxID=1332631 RepID=A0ABW6BYL4_9BACT
MIDKQDELYKDMMAVRQLPVVPTMLEVICQITEMRFAAVARVTQARWLACSVRDEVQFGLEEGGELKVETTLCNEIRDSHKPIVIDDVDIDPLYKHHHTPKIYGLKSYISVPIFLKDGTFFGTLCAIDARPAKVNNSKIIGMFTMFADLLAFHLQSLDLLERSHTANIELQNKNKTLSNTNFDLDSFVYIASHDLKVPIANIKGLLHALSETVAEEDLDREAVNQIIGMMKDSLKRLTVTVKELSAVVKIEKNCEEGTTEEINIAEVVEDVKQDLHHLLLESGAEIEVNCKNAPKLNFLKKNLKSILSNLLSNAIKYRSPERPLKVIVKLYESGGKVHLSVTDNGLGIPSDRQDKVFTMFKRFHDHVKGSGLGLYIVKRMIDKAGGRIKVRSTLNKGTTITITF